MDSAESPLASPLPWNLVSTTYVHDNQPHFARYAGDALALAGVGAGSVVADVATGPGTLALLAARAGARVRALDFAENMIELLRKRAEGEGLANVEAVVGDGTSLPWEAESFDAAFSMFGLIFFPDRARGFAELRRVLRPGGRAVVSSWAPIGGMPPFKELFAALRAELPQLPMGEAKTPLSDPDDLRREMAEAGLTHVVVHERAHEDGWPSVDELWTRVGRSMAPLVLLRRQLGEQTWERVGRGVRARMHEALGTAPLRVSMTAYLAVGAR